MIEELITMLENVMSKITDSSNMGRSGYDSAKKLRNELALYIEELKKGNADCLNELNIHFLPTSTFQEHSLENNWADEYLELSEQFDRIYAQSKTRD